MRKLRTHLCAVAGALLLCTPPASATQLTVTSAIDILPGSLRAQVNAANPGDTIVFSALTNNITQTLTAGQISFSKRLTFIGNDTTTTTVSGGLANRIFNISSGDSVTIIKVKFVNGTSTGNGGAILATDTKLKLVSVSISASTASQSGGAFYITGADASVSGSKIYNCTANGTAATDGGGGIYANTAPLPLPTIPASATIARLVPAAAAAECLSIPAPLLVPPRLPSALTLPAAQVAV